jgi:hypothetical protein
LPTSVLSRSIELSERQFNGAAEFSTQVRSMHLNIPNAGRDMEKIDYGEI